MSPWVEKVKAGETQALAKLLTDLECNGLSALGEATLLTPEKASLRIGITGPPGAGKSTLISVLIKAFRQQNMSVGVIAVDPSSPFTNGAILGDRIRYSEHFNDDKVFIRSLGSRGSLGGLSASTYLMLRAYDLFGFDVVLIETVGVGQTELEIMHVADTVSVVLVPESGDSVQAMKAGLLEIADLFIVNKADRLGADSFARELQNTFALDGDKAVKVFKTVANQGQGIELLVETYRQLMTADLVSRRLKPEYLRREAKALLRMKQEAEIDQQTEAIKGPSDLLELIKNS